MDGNKLRIYDELVRLLLKRFDFVKKEIGTLQNSLLL